MNVNEQIIEAEYTLRELRQELKNAVDLQDVERVESLTKEIETLDFSRFHLIVNNSETVADNQ